MTERLVEGKESASFFYIIRALLAQKEGAVAPGQRGPFHKEAVFMRPNASLGFPERDVHSIEPFESGVSGLPDTLVTVNFLGLYGPASPLPAYFTEDILYAGIDDSYVRRFLDIFNHRLISYLYRSWEKYRYYIQYESAAEDKFSQKMFSFFGVEQAVLRENSQLDWARLLSFVGVLGLKTGSVSVMRKVIAYYFSLSHVEIKQNIEQRVAIDSSQLNCLGKANSHLGTNMSLGQSVLDHATKFRVCLGALSYERFKTFLPCGKNYRALKELVVFCAGAPLQFDIELVLNREELPACALSREADARLGLSACLGKVEAESVSVFVS